MPLDQVEFYSPDQSVASVIKMVDCPLSRTLWITSFVGNGRGITDKVPGKLIRLIKQTTVPAGVEQAYRIIVDEIPQPQDDKTPQIGLKIQMRYSIPLFAYGQGIATQREGANHALVETRDLSWRTVRDGGKPAIEFTNRSDVHVRLSNVKVQQGGQSRELADGLLGYVLPGSTRHFPLPAGISSPSAMTATINARDTTWQSAPAR